MIVKLVCYIQYITTTAVYCTVMYAVLCITVLYCTLILQCSTDQVTSPIQVPTMKEENIDKGELSVKIEVCTVLVLH